MQKHVPKLLLGLIALMLPVALFALNQQQNLGSKAQSTAFTFSAAGDIGSKADSLSNMDTVAQSGSQFFIGLGDLTYESSAEQKWCSTFKSKFKDVEIIAGNHDVGESSGGNIDEYIKHCPFTLGSLQGTYGKEYYFDYPQTGTPLARFILISPGIKGSMNTNYASGGSGYTFTQQAIDDARAKNIKWVVVGMHKNCITAGTKSCEIGQDIMNLLIQKKVDVILQGHDHIYHRSHALSCVKVDAFDSSCIADDGSDGQYEKGKGPVIIINGEGGQELYNISESDSEFGYFAKSDDTTFGVVKYTISDTQLSAQYLKAAGGSFADTFTINASASTQPTTTAPTFPQPTAVTPTLFCLGGVPCTSPEPTVEATVPPIGGTYPTTNPSTTGTVDPNTTPSPTINPCETQSSLQHYKHKKHKRGNGGGWISKFIEFLLKFIMMLLQMLGIQPSNPNPLDPTNPNPVDPTPCPEATVEPTIETPTTEPTVEPTVGQTITETPSVSPAVSPTTANNAQLPAQVFSLTNWKLTLPTGSAGKPTEILQPDLATYKNDPYFVVSGGGIRFRAPVNGVTTSGSSYPRSELREMNGSSLASWSSSTGTHVMSLDQAITAVPATKKHVVVGQIHDAEDDVIVIRLEDKKLFVDVNGTDGPTLDANYTLGKRFQTKFEVKGGKTTIYYNGSTTPAYTLSKNYSGAYFKVGAYTQSNCSTDSGNCNANNYGESIIYSATVTHQ